MLTAALSPKARTWRHNASANRCQMKRLWGIHTSEHYAAGRGDEILQFTATYFGCKISHGEDRSGVISLICGIWRKQRNRQCQTMTNPPPSRTKLRL